MKYGDEVVCRYSMLELLPKRSIDLVNSLFGTKYSKADIRKQLQQEKLSFEEIKKLMEEATTWKEKI
jgi:hypothetical protein